MRLAQRRSQASAGRPGPEAWVALFCLLLGCLVCNAVASCQAVPASAEQTASERSTVAPRGSERLMPEAPGFTGRIEGEVLDSSGALVPGAHVLLHVPDRAHDALAVTDAEGRYVFANLPAGRYSYVVTAPGFQDFASAPFPLGLAETRQMESVTLIIPTGHADAYVTLNRKEIAAAEVHAAEQQRIVGFPDFYTSFVWNATPMDAGQKLSLGLHATTDRMAFVTAALVASGEQIKGTFPEYGSDAAGFGKRYGAAYADGFVGKFLGGAIFPSVFRQDPRYFYMGPHGTLKQRLRHAVLSGIVTRGDNGRMQANYSHILGNASAGAISTLYHPAADSAGKLALDNALLGSVGEAGVNVVRELFLKRFVRGGDVDANGMP